MSDTYTGYLNVDVDAKKKTPLLGIVVVSGAAVIGATALYLKTKKKK